MTTKQFNRLSKAKKAVLVAEDILLQLTTEKYIANTGTYIMIEKSEFELNVEKEDDIKSNFDKINHCEVCALGSVLLSCTKMGNLLTFNDINIENSSIDSINNNNVKKLLSSVFDTHTLLLIETAFEGYEPFEYAYNLNEYKEYWELEGNEYSEAADRFAKNIYEETLSFEECAACTKFFRKYKDDDKRLRAICKNIIKNNGKFVL